MNNEVTEVEIEKYILSVIDKTGEENPNIDRDYEFNRLIKNEDARFMATSIINLKKVVDKQKEA